MFCFKNKANSDYYLKHRKILHLKTPFLVPGIKSKLKKKVSNLEKHHSIIILANGPLIYITRQASAQLCPK